MVGGHWMPELVNIAGGEPLLAEAGAPTRAVEWEAVRDAAPEVLIQVDLAGEATKHGAPPAVAMEIAKAAARFFCVRSRPNLSSSRFATRP